MAGKDRIRLLSIREALSVVPVSERTFYRRLADGTVPVVEFGGRTFIDPVDLNLVARKRCRSLIEKGPACEPSLSSVAPDPGGDDAAG
jgi:hypothetical protein